MNWLALHAVSQLWIERVLNSLPEGLLIAFLAWLLLRLAGRQNSGTRFAVWFVALVAIAALPFVGMLHSGSHPLGSHWIGGAAVHPHLIVPASWALALFAAWAVAACAAGVQLVAGLFRVRSLRATCTPVDLAQLDPALAETVRNFNHSRPVTLATSEDLRVPSALGFLHPMIVLPAWALRELPPAELRVILLHEFEHLRRRDDWTNLFQKAVRAVFFFHPAVWWIDSRLSLEREMACDDAVLAQTGSPHAYATCLVSLLEKSCARRGWVMAQAAVHRVQEASLRIAQILDKHRPGGTRISKPALALAGLGSLAGIAVLLCTPRLVVFGPNVQETATRAIDSGIDAPGALRMIPAAYHFPAPQQRNESSPAMKQALAKPAVLRTAATVRRTIPENPAHSNPPAAAPLSTVPRIAATRIVAPQHRPAVILASARRSNPARRMAPQMVVLIQTTQYVETDAAGLPVQSWQVQLILVNPQEGIASGTI